MGKYIISGAGYGGGGPTATAIVDTLEDAKSTVEGFISSDHGNVECTLLAEVDLYREPDDKAKYVVTFTKRNKEHATTGHGYGSAINRFDDLKRNSYDDVKVYKVVKTIDYETHTSLTVDFYDETD